MDSASTTDAVAQFCAAAETNDVDRMVAVLAPDAEVISPVSGRMVFTGHADLRVLLNAIFGSISGLQWTRTLADANMRVALATGRIGPVHLTDAMVVRLDPDGNIEQISPHLRPWLALTLITLALAPKLARHPGVIVRALRHKQPIISTRGADATRTERTAGRG